MRVHSRTRLIHGGFRYRSLMLVEISCFVVSYYFTTKGLELGWTRKVWNSRWPRRYLFLQQLLISGVGALPLGQLCA